ncbi:hypothetical protein ABBQ32_004048 [Trebouxia sp. C0010 RCD-2024]
MRSQFPCLNCFAPAFSCHALSFQRTVPVSWSLRSKGPGLGEQSLNSGPKQRSACGGLIYLPKGAATTTKRRYRMAKREVKQADSLERPQHNSFVFQETYTCSFGPEDYRSRLPEGLTQKERAKDSRLGIRDKGTSRKRGCLSGFTATKLYLWPDVMQLSVKHPRHTDAAGNPVHGSHILAQDVQHHQGYHSAIKGNELARKSRLQGRMVDWLLWLLWNEAYKTAGFQTNGKAEGLVTSAVIAAQAIPDSFSRSWTAQLQ